ncbi:MAG: hypothetical protein K8R85_00635 [Bacteroidetes bacterium]|nr:hypothetical protein [Bacteroidota bacterium]
MAVNKILGFGIISVFVGLIIKGAVNVAQAANAVDKLTYDLEDIKIKKIEYFSGFIPKGVIYSIDIQLNNPTAKELVITKPYITISIPDSLGKYTRVANTSEPGNVETKIRSNSNIKLNLDIEIRFLNVIPFLPNFVAYIISRLKGIKATQKVLVNATIDSMGITIPIDKVMEI